MQRLRLLIDDRRGWVALLFACALAARLMAPAGFMPVEHGGHVTLQVCAGMVAPPAAAMAGMHHGEPGETEHGKAETPCAYAGAGLIALGAVEPVVLLAAIAFAFVLASRRVEQLLPVLGERLRPPLRAPPHAA